MSDQPAGPRRLLYGRRKGHKLRQKQSGLVETLLPRLRVDLPADGCLDPRTCVAPPARQVWLEIGFGGGEHLHAQALANPDVGLIGCEPFVNGVAKLLSDIERSGVQNIRIYDDDARDLLDVLADRCLDRIFVLFPDPWPKTRHHKRRFVTPDNLDRLARVMVSGGELRFASDISDYVRWTLRHIRAHGAF
ncbi:MAG: tRNA (guanosine(46)-N7)-methyltransferase TrmB, partial [Hyphomicrobiales bacterium]